MAVFNGVTLTEQSIMAARQHGADLSNGCADDVISGAVRVNDVDAYLRKCREDAQRYLSGAFDHSVSFLQLAYFIQTGESVALLP